VSRVTAKRASATTKRLLPKGTFVRLLSKPVSDPVDTYGRLLRYVVRAKDGMNINLRLVAAGAAAPWCYDGERGRFAAKLSSLALRAKAKRLGLWGACPPTPYSPDAGIASRR
jgi:endonuclease YncB( thermonuclease family)